MCSPYTPKGRKTSKVTKKIKAAGGELEALVKNKIVVLEKIRNACGNAIVNNKPVPVFDNLLPILSSMEVLQVAYSNIKSNKGSTTKGVLDNTSDGMSLERLKSLSQRLKNKTYKFPPVRRIWVPKPKKIDWRKKENLVKHGRPLGMPDFDAKVVQEAMRMVLSAIYEPLFDKANVSFGFRPGLGCHDAVKDFESQTQGMDIAIEGDIKAAFPSLDHSTLINILSKRIQDKAFLDLVLSACRARIFDELQNSTHDPLIGVPQGGIVSPILWNIYMHEFDKFILTDIDELINTLNTRIKNPTTRKPWRTTGKTNPNSKAYREALATRNAYRQMYASILRGRREKDLTPKDKEDAVKFRLLLRYADKRLHKTPSKDMRRAKLRFFYIRYADDWIFFTNAKETVALYIKKKIASFLHYHLKLTLADEKTKITTLSKNKAKFLGFSIHKLTTSPIITSKWGGTKRSTNNKNKIGIDKDRVLNRLLWRGLIDSKQRPRELPGLSTLTDFEIVSRYNAMIRGYVGYYAPIITNRHALNHFVYIFEYSCYKTLCQKHRTTIRTLLRKHGQPLVATLGMETIPNAKTVKAVSLLTAKVYWNALQDTVKNMKSNLKQKTRNQGLLATGDFLRYAKAFWRTSFKLQEGCAICGSTDHIQMHHLRHVKGYNAEGNQQAAKLMGFLNRKQIPVCKFHHEQIHKGLYDDTSLHELYDVRLATVENELRIFSRRDPKKIFPEFRHQFKKT